ncbi:MAG: tetraacyldisaccharide 4'-kinase [Gammaproteobacteria bacterium]|nr:MAG: tetraacyldisaccharide 4'-kinase [Gammaproteobacteria bacterium]
MTLETHLNQRWYGRPGWLWVLWPLEGVFRLLTRWRRKRLTRKAVRLPVPVLIVGNITVGGTGKSPLVAALARHLTERGLKVGIVSRGYGGAGPYPALANEGDVGRCGDEPVMLARMTGVPVCVSPNRVQAARELLKQGGIDIILSDDGLQHYALGRDLEIVVLDAQRKLGNGHCLPMGPLREPAERLNEVDFRVWNGGNESCDWPMKLKPVGWLRATDGQSFPLEHLEADQVHAVAAIGHPERFFSTLAALPSIGRIQRHVFPDHHPFQSGDLPDTCEPVVMTMKDAVKCQKFAGNNTWALKVEAELPEAFWHSLDSRLNTILEHRGKHG